MWCTEGVPEPEFARVHVRGMALGAQKMRPSQKAADAKNPQQTQKQHVARQPNYSPESRF